MKYVILCVIACVFIVSCETKSDSVNLKDVVNNFIQEEQTPVYGSIDLFGIIQKAGVTELPVFGELIEEQLESIGASIHIDQKLYFAMDGALNDEGTPQNLFAFAAVKNRDSLIDLFSRMGYFFEEENGVYYSFDMNSAIGFTESVLSMVTTDFDKDSEEEIRKVMSKMKSTGKEKSTEDLFQNQGDLFIVSNLGAVDFIPSIDQGIVDADEIEQIKSMLEELRSITNLSFLDGKLSFTNEFEFGDAMEEFMILSEVDQQKVLDKIELSNPMFAFSMALDIPKLEKLLKKYNPDALKELYASLGTAGLILRGLGGEGIESIFDGSIVASLDNIQSKLDLTELPAFSLHAGVGKAGEVLLDVLLDLADVGEIQKDNKGNYVFEDILLKMRSNELHLMSASKSGVENGKTQLLNRFPDFGSTPVSFFFDIEKLMRTNPQLVDQDLRPVVSIMDYFTFQMSKDKASMDLYLLNKNENILKQLVDALQEQLQGLAEEGLMI